MCRKAQNSVPDSMMDMGRVSTQAIIKLRTVPHCRPVPFAAIVPATPEDSTCVVLTGKLGFLWLLKFRIEICEV